jgi:hypothetical protein
MIWSSGSRLMVVVSVSIIISQGGRGQIAFRPSFLLCELYWLTRARSAATVSGAVITFR